jgi:hypothetical protein
MCFNKPVTKELPYWLLREHRIAEKLLVELLLQKRLSLVPYERLFHRSGIQPNMSQHFQSNKPITL